MSYAHTAVEAVSEADLVFILTEWEEFKNIYLYKGKTVFDGRKVLQPDEVEGIDYEGICW